MRSRFVVAVVALWGATTMAIAAVPDASNLSTPILPTFALNAESTEASPWTGLYVGTEVFGFSGSKGVRGGFGGGGFAGYDRELDNNVVVGVRGSLGYAPGLYSHSAITGFNYFATDVRVGYDMGRSMPFVTAGIGVAKPNLRDSGSFGGVTNAANDLFNSTGDPRSFQTVGAGFAYKLTNRLTVELAVQAYHGNGFVGP